MSEEAEKPEANVVAEEPKKTAQDHYASFIGQQMKRTSLFDTKGYKPTTPDDVARATGKK